MAAARDAEQEWQIQRARDYISGKVADWVEVKD
jgi:hypothetical protein